MSSSAGTKASTQVEDVNFRLSTRFLEHRPVTSPLTNQRKVTHPVALTPNFAYKIFSPKTIREFRVFEHKPPIPMHGPVINLTLLGTLMFQFVWPHSASST